jgi:hypothetical protein
MSEITLFKNSGNLPAYLKNIELDADTLAIAGGGSSFKRISIRGGVFRMVVGGKEIATKEGRSLDVVVVRAAHKPSRTFYAESYREGEKLAPSCWSTDGTKPDEGVANKQASTCANCPQNIKGSGNGEGRACRFSRRMAVVLADDLQGDIYQFVIPATSIFGAGEPNKLPFEAYVQLLKAHNIPLGAAVTEVRFDTQATGQKLLFRAVKPLEEGEHEIIKARGEDPAALAAIRMSVAQTDKVPAAPKQGSLFYSKEEDVEDAPVKKPSKPAAPVPAPKGDSVEDVLDNWDDEE